MSKLFHTTKLSGGHICYTNAHKQKTLV